LDRALTPAARSCRGRIGRVVVGDRDGIGKPRWLAAALHVTLNEFAPGASETVMANEPSAAERPAPATLPAVNSHQRIFRRRPRSVID